RVEERSTDPNVRNVYLLHLGSFLDDSTTLLGTNLVTEDLYLFEKSPDFSLRFRYIERKGFTQLATNSERTFGREQSVRLRWQFLAEITNQTDFILKNDNLTSAPDLGRNRGVSSTNVVMDWSYKPDRRVELGFNIAFGQADNFDTTKAD